MRWHHVRESRHRTGPPSWSRFSSLKPPSNRFVPPYSRPSATAPLQYHAVNFNPLFFLYGGSNTSIFTLVGPVWTTIAPKRHLAAILVLFVVLTIAERCECVPSAVSRRSTPSVDANASDTSANVDLKYRRSRTTREIPSRHLPSELNAIESRKSDTNRSSENSVRVSRNGTKYVVDGHQNDGGFVDETEEEEEVGLRGTQLSMPPAHAQDNESGGAVHRGDTVAPAGGGAWALVAVLLAIAVTGAALGAASCLLTHRRAAERGGAAADLPPARLADSRITTPMLSVVSAGAAAAGMERLRGGRSAARELAASRDRQVRLHAVRADIAVDLPPSIAMPDGEEHAFATGGSRLHLRDPEQESEIYQKCIRPPPNRTVLESESPPPYRSSSAGVLASSSSSSSSTSSSDWSSGTAPLVVRCHSMSSTSTANATLKTPHPQHAPAPAGQKTDFLQRTVKIFTGHKKTHHQQSPAPTLPVVVVPSGGRTRRETAPTTRPKPPSPFGGGGV